MVVRELLTVLGFKLNDAPLKKAERGIAAFKRSAILMGAAVAGIGATVFGAVKSAANFGDELLRTSQKVGLSVESLQKLQYAAGIADVTTEQLTQSMGLLARRLVAAQGGSKEAIESFKKIKIDPRQIKDNETLLLKISEQFQKLPDGAQKTALAMDLFGRSGASLIPFLNQGPEAIRGFGKELEDLGLIFGKDLAEKSDALNDNFFRLKYIWGSLIQISAAKLIPKLLELTDVFIGWLKVNKDSINENLTDFFEGLGKVLKFVWIIGRAVVKGFIKIGATLGLSGVNVVFLTGVIYGLSKAFGILWAAIGLGPAIWVTVFALILAVVYNFRKEIIAVFKGIWDYLLGKWNRFFDDVKVLLTEIGRAFYVVFEAIGNAVLHPIDFIKGKFSQAFTEIARDIVQKITGAFHDILDLFDLPKALGLDTNFTNKNTGSPMDKLINANLPFVLGRDNVMSAPVPSSISGGPVSNNETNQNNTFKIDQKINVNLESTADPKLIGEKTAKAAQSEFERSIRSAARSLKGGEIVQPA